MDSVDVVCAALAAVHALARDEALKDGATQRAAAHPTAAAPRATNLHDSALLPGGGTSAALDAALLAAHARSAGAGEPVRGTVAAGGDASTASASLASHGFGADDAMHWRDRPVTNADFHVLARVFDALHRSRLQSLHRKLQRVGACLSKLQQSEAALASLDDRVRSLAMASSWEAREAAKHVPDVQAAEEVVQQRARASQAEEAKLTRMRRALEVAKSAYFAMFRGLASEWDGLMLEVRAVPDGQWAGMLVSRAALPAVLLAVEATCMLLGERPAPPPSRSAGDDGVAQTAEAGAASAAVAAGAAAAGAAAALAVGASVRGDVSFVHTFRRLVAGGTQALLQRLAELDKERLPESVLQELDGPLYLSSPKFNPARMATQHELAGLLARVVRAAVGFRRTAARAASQRARIAESEVPLAHQTGVVRGTQERLRAAEQERDEVAARYTHALRRKDTLEQQMGELKARAAAARERLLALAQFRGELVEEQEACRTSLQCVAGDAALMAAHVVYSGHLAPARRRARDSAWRQLLQTRFPGIAFGSQGGLRRLEAWMSTAARAACLNAGLPTLEASTAQAVAICRANLMHGRVPLLIDPHGAAAAWLLRVADKHAARVSMIGRDPSGALSKALAERRLVVCTEVGDRPHPALLLLLNERDALLQPDSAHAGTVAPPAADAPRAASASSRPSSRSALGRRNSGNSTEAEAAEAALWRTDTALEALLRHERFLPDDLLPSLVLCTSARDPRLHPALLAKVALIDMSFEAAPAMAALLQLRLLDAARPNSVHSFAMALRKIASCEEERCVLRQQFMQRVASLPALVLEDNVRQAPLLLLPLQARLTAACAAGSGGRAAGARRRAGGGGEEGRAGACDSGAVGGGGLAAQPRDVPCAQLAHKFVAHRCTRQCCRWLHC